MMSNLEEAEICKLKEYFEFLTKGKGRVLSRDKFLDIPCISNNPLKDRLVIIFGYNSLPVNAQRGLSFPAFLHAVARFNAVKAKMLADLINWIKLVFRKIVCQIVRRIR